MDERDPATPSRSSAAQDLAPAARPGLRRRQPAGRVLRGRRPVRGLRRAGALYPYGDKVDDAADFYRDAARQPSPTRASSTALPKDFSHARRWSINTDALDGGRADRRRRAHHLGRSCRPSPSKLTTGEQVGLGFTASTRPGRRLHGAGRRLAGERGRHRGHRGHPGEPRRRWSTCKANARKGDFAYSATLDAGWGGEALGKGKAAMTPAFMTYRKSFGYGQFGVGPPRRWRPGTSRRSPPRSRPGRTRWWATPSAG